MNTNLVKMPVILAILISVLPCPLPAVDAPVPAPSPFAIRGTLPWHNFLSGPTAWNEDDYRVYLDDLAARKLNFVGFHNYTGGAERYAPYVEPIIRVPYRDVLPEATFDTSLTARWGYRPLAVGDFAFGTDKLFAPLQGGEAFGAACALTPKTNADRYRAAHGLMRKVIELAHARGIAVAIGFEFGIHPPELASIVPPESRLPGAMMPDPTHPANIEILHNTLDDILDEYGGVDYVWLWLHEHSMFVGPAKLGGRFGAMYEKDKALFAEANDPQAVFTGVWSLAYIRSAQEYLARRSPKTRLVIGGWGGGVQLPSVLRGLDRALPAEVVFSCLNPGQGGGVHVPVLTDIAKRRPAWSIPWLEGDGSLWHLQLRSGSVIEQVKAADEAKLSGVVAIHWRTEEIRPNLEAFALAAADPRHAPAAAEFYRGHCTDRYGPASAGELAPLLLALEREGALGHLHSPEYYPYDPTWGRVSKALAGRLTEAIALIERIKAQTKDPRHLANLDWLAENLRFTLLLDEVGRKIEPVYRLKESFLRGEVQAADLPHQAAGARREFQSAPMKELFETFARRTRSRGELGELSAINQKLYLQYRELDRFLTSAGQ